MQDPIDNEFLELMRLKYKEVLLLSKEEVLLIRESVDKLINYFNSPDSSQYTTLFQQTVRGKLGALNSALIRAGYPSRVNSSAARRYK